MRQGCPLSPYIFILCAEVLANAIRKNTKIKGIKINETECKISQYADDTTIFLDGSKNVLQESLETLDSFGKVSGLKINNFKTEVLWVGTLSKNTNILLPERNLKWATGSVKALGVHFAANEEVSMKLNTEEKLDKIKKLVENWELRKLNIFGKISVIKALLASQLVYILTPLRTCPKTLKEVNALLFKFLWDDKGDKFKRSVMINEYENRGARMLDILSFNRALNATWVTKYFNSTNKGKWKNLFDYYLDKLGGKTAFLYSLNKKRFEIFNITDKFTQEIFEIWAELHFRPNLESFADFLEQDLWNNSLIRIDNSPVFFEKWKNIGVCKVKHLLENSPYLRFFNHKQFQLKYEIKTPYLKFLGLISSVYCLQRKINSELGTIKQESKSLIQNTISGVSSSKDFYKSFVRNLGTKPETTQSKWEKDCNKEDLRWEKIYSKPFECSNSSK